MLSQILLNNIHALVIIVNNNHVFKNIVTHCSIHIFDCFIHIFDFGASQHFMLLGEG